jgi:hypothetical protein
MELREILTGDNINPFVYIMNFLNKVSGRQKIGGLQQGSKLA